MNHVRTNNLYNQSSRYSDKSSSYDDYDYYSPDEKPHCFHRGRIVLFIITTTFIIGAALFTRTYFNTIRTACSVDKISSEPAYYARIYGNFHYDEYLKAGATSYKELENFIYDAYSLNLFNGNQEIHGCSGFFATTPEGDYILVQDYDTPKSNQLPIVLYEDYYNKVLGIASCGSIMENHDNFSIIEKVITNAAPYTMKDGINKHGLSVVVATANGSYCNNDPDKVTILSDTVPNTILNNATTVDEAIELLRGFNIARTNNIEHFLIADANGNSAVVEWVYGTMQVIYPDDHTNYQIFSNFILYHNDTLDGFGSDRYIAYQRALESCNGIITEKDALELLKQNTIPSDACWSVVYNLTQRTMNVTFHNDYEHIYTYSIK